MQPSHSALPTGRYVKGKDARIHIALQLVQTAVQTSKHMVSDLTGGINPMIERSICGFSSYSIYLPVDLLSI